MYVKQVVMNIREDALADVGEIVINTYVSNISLSCSDVEETVEHMLAAVSKATKGDDILKK